MKICLYARVSTADKCPVCRKLATERTGASGLRCPAGHEFLGKAQDTENQLSQLREHARLNAWEIVTEYIDRKSGKDGERDQFKELFLAAERKEFEAVLVWALDRFTREGIHETFVYIAKLSAFNCKFISFMEPQFSTTGPFGELMIALSAWIAKQERARISDRTKAGLAAARKEGRIGGRKPVEKNVSLIVELRGSGMSLDEVAVKTGVSRATVDRVFKKNRVLTLPDGFDASEITRAMNSTILPVVLENDPKRKKEKGQALPT